jgi:hypothetical protein
MDDSSNICYCYFRERVDGKPLMDTEICLTEKIPTSSQDLRIHKDDITNLNMKKLVLRAPGFSDHML